MLAVVVERDKPIVIRGWTMLNIFGCHERIKFALCIRSLLDGHRYQSNHIRCDRIFANLMLRDISHLTSTVAAACVRSPCCPAPTGVCLLSVLVHPGGCAFGASRFDFPPVPHFVPDLRTTSNTTVVWVGIDSFTPVSCVASFSFPVQVVDANLAQRTH